MEKKGGLRVGKGGLIGGNPLVSVRTLASLLFPNTDCPSNPAAKAIVIITISCAYLFALFK